MKKPKIQVTIDLEPGGTKYYRIKSSSPAETDFAEKVMSKVRDSVELLESELHKAYEKAESEAATLPGRR